MGDICLTSEDTSVGTFFLTLYFLFFGAVLSAEISTHHFSGLHLYTTTARPFWRLATRVLFLIVLRLVYLGWAYSVLMQCSSFGQNLSFFFQPIVCAVLSLPIFGIAQLSYRFEPPPVVDPPKQKFPNGSRIIVYSYTHCLAWAFFSILPAVSILLWIALTCQSRNPAIPLPRTYD